MRMTVDEIRLVTFIILGLLVGAIVKNWRDAQRALLLPVHESALATKKTSDSRKRRPSADAAKHRPRGSTDHSAK